VRRRLGMEGAVQFEISAFQDRSCFAFVLGKRRKNKQKQNKYNSNTQPALQEKLSKNN